jgi:hypothetical protein
MDRERRGDLTLTSFATLLAAGSLAFALYMNLAPERDRIAGINARNANNAAPRRQTPEADRDDLITASIAPPLYRLVTVVGDKAYVEDVEGGSALLIAVTRGSFLAGAGRVTAIENRAGRWVVVTTGTTITADARP